MPDAALVRPEVELRVLQAGLLKIWIGPLVHQTLQTFSQELILRPRKGKATEMRYCDF